MIDDDVAKEKKCDSESENPSIVDNLGQIPKFNRVLLRKR
jgi:hypothetical protein